MGLADVLIFTFAAVVDLGVLISLRHFRRRRRQRGAKDRIARSLALAFRYQRI